MKTKSPFLREVYLKEKPATLDQFPFNIPALDNGDLHLKFEDPVTFFVGENGSGKSTVLEAIAVECGFNPSGGSRNNVYDFRRTESSLAHFLRLVWNFKITQGFFLRAESFFNFASYLEQAKEELPGEDYYGPYGGKSLHERSHGESFMALFEHRFQRGIYLLDEPEAALSPQRQIKFLGRLHEFVKAGESQFVIATHSPILLSYPMATILAFGENGITPTTYADTEHFRVTKDFLNSYPTFYKHLLQEDCAS
jgi:predicted ATPase